MVIGNGSVSTEERVRSSGALARRRGQWVGIVPRVSSNTTTHASSLAAQPGRSRGCKCPQADQCQGLALAEQLGGSAWRSMA